MKNIPRHVAIIMDGNGRWAKSKHLPVLEGHRKGAEALRQAAYYAKDKGISYLTVYAFSTENWRRSKIEVTGLINLIRFNIKQHLQELIDKDIKIKIIGDLLSFPEDVRLLINDAVAKTACNTSLTLSIALNYGGRQEIIRSAQCLAKDVQEGRIAPQDIKEENIEEYLYTKGTPDPDLLIRTSGEERISNFLLWQSAYSEFYFPSVYWPDFGEKEFDEALKIYSSRQRRFGARPA